MEPNLYEAPVTPPEPTTLANPVSLKPPDYTLLILVVIVATVVVALLCVIPAMMMPIN
jgi:hypothetical protein